MITGDTSTFAIESYIAEAYEDRGLLALGYFVVHISGKSFGVRQPNATMLACSFDTVVERIANRGLHIAEFSSHLKAEEIADLFRMAEYGALRYSQADNEHSIIALETFRKPNNLVWAPDGDTAFDDGSYILQFDEGALARIIAFRCQANGLHDPNTIVELRIAANVFYGVLDEWRDSFCREVGHFLNRR